MLASYIDWRRSERNKRVQNIPAHRLSVAPMMDWTDRHCRFFHRLMTRRARLYSEMVTASAVIHGADGDTRSWEITWVE